ncbi:MAG: EAL domain-containing protein [Gammaproteobacteria bacterium]|nr:EAL domain-containing protein [Gammaproteobacteria bacterium]
MNAVFIVLVLGLSIDAGWEAVLDYRSATMIQAATRLSDDVIRATAATAMERGMTSAFLGGAPPPDSQTRPNLVVVRQEAERLWQAVRGAVIYFKDNIDFAHALETAEARYSDLREARQAVDRFIDAGGEPIEAHRWIETVAQFNLALENLRSAAFRNERWHSELMRLNLSLRHWIWLVSEYAGLERGTLAYYVSRREPIPADVERKLNAYRGLVEHNLAEIQAAVQQPDVDGRVRAAEAAMRSIFYNQFNVTRTRIYVAASAGDYPLSGEEWTRQATRAIDSVLALAYATSIMSDEVANGIAHASFWHLLRHVGIALVAIILAWLSVTKVRQTANQLCKEKELAEVTLHSIGDAVITTDANGCVEYLNPVAEQYTGWTTAEAEGRPLREILNLVNGFTHDPEEDPVTECLRLRRVVALKDNTVMRRRDGGEVVIEDSAAPIHDSEGRVVGAVMVFYDVSANSDAHHLLAHYATHDALTGLVNRREFDRRLTDLLTRSKRRGEEHALCYIDLDQFKIINDTCGHMVGDKLLCQLTYLLEHHIRDTDTLARLGGDEFGLLLKNCPLARAKKVAETIRNVVKQFRFVWEGTSFDLACSIGLVPITANSISPAEILSEADAACYVAKEKGRNRVQLFQPGDDELARRHGEMQWVSRLQQALRENRLMLYYQDIVPFSADGAMHREILLRLRDEDGQIVPPMSFIPAAERYNLMPEIDRWVIRNVCEWIGRAGNEDAGAIYNINLSGASVSECNGLRNFIIDIFAEYDVAPGRVCFEITETAAVRNLVEATELIDMLKKCGFLFALDDFGSGLSSFMYLKTLPVDLLKIDGNFVRDMVTNPIDHAMVEAINRIGHVMNIKTVAEFVEDEAIADCLRQLGVDYGQGYGLGRPRPLEALRDTEAVV